MYFIRCDPIYTCSHLVSESVTMHDKAPEQECTILGLDILFIIYKILGVMKVIGTIGTR